MRGYSLALFRSRLKREASAIESVHTPRIQVGAYRRYIHDKYSIDIREEIDSSLALTDPSSSSCASGSDGYIGLSPANRAPPGKGSICSGFETGDHNGGVFD